MYLVYELLERIVQIVCLSEPQQVECSMEGWWDGWLLQPNAPWPDQ